MGASILQAETLPFASADLPVAQVDWDYDLSRLTELQRPVQSKKHNRDGFSGQAYAIRGTATQERVLVSAPKVNLVAPALGRVGVACVGWTHRRGTAWTASTRIVCFHVEAASELSGMRRLCAPPNIGPSFAPSFGMMDSVAFCACSSARSQQIRRPCFRHRTRPCVQWRNPTRATARLRNPCFICTRVESMLATVLTKVVPMTSASGMNAKVPLPSTESSVSSCESRL